MAYSKQQQLPKELQISMTKESATNTHSKNHNAISEKEVMNLEGMNAFMNLNKQRHHQTQQHLELRDRKVDCLQSAAVNAQFPPWRPHSYLRMGESQHQEQGSFNQGKSMTTNNQHHSSTNANQSQYSQNIHFQTHSNWRRTEY
ncbi:hypothetical protein AHAS_Ahas02G0138300 [Arachis hypogaea]